MMPEHKRRRLALVTPWFGFELIGGAERLAWELAHALAGLDIELDVLCTTCRSFHDDWGANYHRAGTRSVDGFTVRRFKVDSRDRAAFTRANTKLVTLPRISLRRDVAPLPERDVRAFFSDNITSAALLDHLRERGDTYDAVLFVPYLYGPTLDGVPLVAPRAFIIPCLHDEAYAYLEPVRATLERARGLLFNSAGEAEVAADIFGPALHAKSTIVGHAVEPPQRPGTPITVGGFAPHRSRYVLYLGRQDRTKNVEFLLEAYRTFRERRISTSLQLVFAGPRPPGTVSRDGILWLDTVAEDTKAALLTYARALVQPSVNESFSRAIYESWYVQRPVIVHADCRATARAVEDSGGGWIGASVDDWVQILTHVDESADDEIDAAGRRGWAAALENGDWSAVARRIVDAVDDGLRGAARGLAIAQAVPLAQPETRRYAAALGAALRGAGADVSLVLVDAPHAEAARLIVHSAGPYPHEMPAAAIVAHSVDAFVPLRAPPLFAPTVLLLEGLVERGLRPRLLPIPVDPGVWAGLLPCVSPVDDGLPAILSIAPLSRPDVERLVEMVVAYIRAAGRLRLLVRGADCDAAALATLERESRELDLQDVVEIVGPTPEEHFAALRRARMAIAFGRALPDMRTAIDPLWFDLPVVAFDDPIVRETIEPCGLVVERDGPRELAAIVGLAARDTGLRQAMISEGRRVRERYAPQTVTRTLLDALLVGGLPSQTRSMRL